MGRVYLNRYSAVEVQPRAVKRKKEKTFAVPRAAAEKIFSVSYCNALWKEKFTRSEILRSSVSSHSYSDDKGTDPQ